MTYLTFKKGEIWMPDITVFEAISLVCNTALACASNVPGQRHVMLVMCGELSFCDALN